MKATSSAPGDASENQANRKEYVGTLSIMSGNKKITIDITYRHGE